MIMMKMAIVWVLAALMLEPMYDPLLIPSAVRSIKGYSSAGSWVIFVVPVIASIIVYLLALIFKIPKSRITHVTGNQKQDLIKEILIRTSIGYCLSYAILGTIYWYLITFFGFYGWQTSWQWFWNCILISFVRIFIYDTFSALFLFFTYKIS